jgi:cytoskeleton protein RodZ
VAAPGPTDPAAKNVEGAAAGFAASEPEVPGADPVGVEPSVEAASSGGSAPESVRGPDPEVPVAADVVTEVSADGAGTRVLAGGEARLSLTFTGDCWVEIRDGDDRVVLRDLHRAGQALDLLGRAPFRVRLGHAPVVELSYNDSRVPLAPHTRNDVASLVIGR